jgi:hypothetical protein
MGHLLKLKCAYSLLNLRILSSTSLPFTLTTVQVPNIALTHTCTVATHRSLSQQADGAQPATHHGAQEPDTKRRTGSQLPTGQQELATFRSHCSQLSKNGEGPGFKLPAVAKQTVRISNATSNNTEA